MPARGEMITVDLRAVQSIPQLMDALGEALELGGRRSSPLLSPRRPSF